MVSAPYRISLAQLSRRRARSAFAVATLALAVASLGLFAMPTLMNRSMHEAVRAGRLSDLTLSTAPLRLDRARLARLRAIPNVTAVEPRATFLTRVDVGLRRAPALVVGVADFAHQQANVVHVDSGAPPAAGEALTEAQNANQGLLAAGTGARVGVLAADGSTRRLRLSGVGGNLVGGQDATSDDEIVLYTTAATVGTLRGHPGFDMLELRLRDSSRSAVAATVAAVRRTLRGVPGFTGFTDLPAVRAPGDWPGKASFNQFLDFFFVITLLALLSALVLTSNTMTTLIAEQTREIGVMRAIGGRRRQIAGVYVRTALLLGALGSAIGAALGVLLANLLVRFLGSSFFAIDVRPGVDTRVLALSLIGGTLGPVLAAAPAIRRAVRVDVRAALEASGSAVGRLDRGERLLRRLRLPRTAQVGLRNLGRRKRRTLAVATTVGLAVGNLLAVLGLAAATSIAVRGAWGDHGEDVKVTTEGARPLDARAARLIRGVPGVAAVEPMFVTDVRVDGTDAIAWAVRSRTMFRYRIAAGRWFTPAEERAAARVVVLQRGVASAAGVRVGDRVAVQTAGGPTAMRVIGVSSNQQEFGTAVYAPLTTMRRALHGGPAAAPDYWVRTTAHDHAAIDRATTRIENRLAAAGFAVGTEIEYVGEANDAASFRTITTTIAVVGFLVVGMSLVGLANAITMSVLERRREIGVLRSIGARSRDVRRIFLAEGVGLALLGWLIGIPLGYLLDRALVWLVQDVAHLRLSVVFPFGNLGLALAGTVALAIVAILLPVRRAVRVRPGDALRYA